MRALLIGATFSLFVACNDASTTDPVVVPAGDTGSSASPERPEIRVQITGVPLPGALLIGQFMEQQYRADTSVVDGNAVVFRNSEPYKPGHYYAYFSDGTGVQLLIDEDQTFTLSADKSDLTGTMQFDGSKTNELLYEALRFEAGQQPAFRQLSAQMQQAEKGTPEYEQLRADRKALVETRRQTLGKMFAAHPGSLFTSFKRAGQNPVLRDVRLPDGQMDEEAQVAGFREDFWDSVDFSDERLVRTPVIFNKLKRYVKELTPQNAEAIKAAADNLMGKVIDYPDYYKFFANWITLQYEPGKSTVMDAEAIHVHMIRNYFTRDRAFWADSMTVWGLQDRASQMAQSLVGDRGPDITVPGLDGRGKRLYDLEKPYVAVFMYNPECDHCIEQTPKLTAAHQRLKGELDVYAIALDTEADKWRDFVRQYGLSGFTNVYDPTNRSIFKTYYVDNTPELYLLGPDRTILAKNLKVEQLAQAIEIAKNKQESRLSSNQ